MSAENQFGSDFEKRVAAAIADIKTPPESDRTSLLNRYTDLPFKAKCQVMFGIFASLSFLMGVTFLISLSMLFNAAQNVNNVHITALEAADLRGSIGEMRYNAVRYVFAGEQEALAATDKNHKKINDDISEIQSVAAKLAPTTMPEIEKLQHGMDEYEASFARFRDSLSSDGKSETTVQIAMQLASGGDALYKQSRELETQLAAQAETIKAESLDRFTWVIISLFALGGLLLAVLFFAMRFISSNLSDKIHEVTNGMTELVSGRYDFQITGGERRDEIGAMIRAMTVFQRGAGRLQKFIKEREQMSQHRSNELNQLADGFERNIGEIATSVAAASSQLRSTAESMTEMAQTSSEQAEEVASATQDASTGAKTAAGASDEFAMAISEISQQASSSAQLARNASESARLADTTISALSASASQIEDIVDLIQSIAKRTNLLALNASIEASRGGDAGRGFAVVASEIKELAARTSRATDEVSDQIRTMQNSTGNSVSALHNIADQIQQLETTAIAIATAVDQQSLAGQDLARSIDLAARNSDKVSSRILDVKEAALGTGRASSQLLQSANDLEAQSTTLNSEMSEFLTRIRAG